MKYSKASHPDLDWSQVKETIKMLTVSVAQVEGSMRIGEDSVGVLAQSFTSMVEDMNAIHAALMALECGENRDRALHYCEGTQEKINSSIVAFQFYDRLQQCLGHVADSLKSLSAIIDTPHRLYNPEEWHQLQQHIRDRYTMESEKVMFDAIHDGKSIDEALALVVKDSPSDTDDDIELF